MRNFVTAVLAAWLAAPAAWAAPAAGEKKAAPVKISGTQLFMRIDELNKRLDELLKNQALMSTKAPTLQGVAAPVAAPAPAGPAFTPRELAQALHESGVYHARAQRMALTARVIRDLTLVAGGIMAGFGYNQTSEGMHQKLPALSQSWTHYNRHYSFRRYTLFSSGISLAGVGLVVGELVDWSAHKAEGKAGLALKRPLEALSAPQP